ncbi:MAG TPA: type II CAAX endopeptidase family protein [Myxococcaceae bacterium]|nr:type II CAAX endopeptidase family protein [Myxococcaceae bacterium]
MNEVPAPDTPTRAPAQALIAASVVLMPLVLFTVGLAVQVLNPGFGVWFTEVFVFLGLSWIALRLSGRDPVRYPGLHPPGAATAAYAVMLGVVNFFGIAVPLLFLAQQVFPQSVVEMFDSARVFRDRTPAETALIVSGVIVAAPLCEEYFFRGVLQRALIEARLRAAWAVAVSSIVFSAIHGDPVGFVARLELGLLFGWLFWRTGSVWPGILAHAANNATTTALWFLQGGEAGEAERPVAAEAASSVALYAAIGVATFFALLRAPARWPALLARRELEERPLPPVGFFGAARPWVLAATASLALLFLLDPRGVAVNWAELRHPIPRTLPSNAPERRELRDLKQRVRSGEVPVSEYRSRLRALSEGGTPTPPTPVPTLRP